MIMTFSMYPQRTNSMPPPAPVFVILGTELSLVVLMMDATIALWNWVSTLWLRDLGQMYSHDTQTQKTDQTDLDA